MREIKFRVWSDKSKSWLKDENILSFYISNDGELEIDCSDWSKSKLTIQQYTGLKDKNGVEIYEGDILEIEFQNIDNECHMINAEVVYDGNGFYEKWEGFDASKVKTHHGLRRLRGSENYEYNGKKFTLGSSEIIGNIFEGVDK